MPITKDTNITERITITLETTEMDMPSTRIALNYLEDAIKALPSKLGEPAILEHVYGLCEDCDGRADGYTCPAKAYLEVEVFEK